ncbi:MAG: putative antitoxin, contains HTH domain [Candidatus Methanocomedens sp.]|nr:MAG: putative antitoxin, contains HTH domain [ANME-2 cluster archaeon]
MVKLGCKNAKLFFSEPLDKILVKTGRYPSKRELIEDAIRTLLRAKPGLKMDVAIELYKKSEVSLSRASKICGLYIEDFKELLKEKGIKISVPSIPNKEVDKEVERILGAGLPRPHFDPPVNGYVQVDQKLEPAIHIRFLPL